MANINEVADEGDVQRAPQVAAALIPTPASFVRLPTVLARVPLGRSRIYELIAEGRLPAPIRISDRASAWLSSDIDRWMQERIDASRGQA
jgi:predicted DNA-binding transcriptional regulator AlpA